ncbi:MAG: hypothetical protein ING06_16925 [Roseomonas sp.]|nr:hypothetical protein [Roseomonas sp.]
MTAVDDVRPTPEQKPQLELLKLRAEVDKLAAEVPKLRNDNRWWNRHTAAVVSAAAVLVTGASVYNVYSAQSEQRTRTDTERVESRARTDREQAEQIARATREQQRLDAERSIRCVELGMRMAEFTREQTRAIGQQDRGGVELLSTTVIRLFPPAEAAAILRAMFVNLPEAIVQEPAAQAALDEVIGELEKGAPAGCDRLRELRLDLPQPRRDPVVVTGVPLPPAQSTACPTLAAAPPGLQSLLVFTQVVQAADRDAARRILDRAKVIDSAFNRAPIEDVRARDPAAQRAEVRYYRRDHEDEAARLVALIQRAACLEGEGERMRDLRAVFIGNRFQNLPDGRIELWFPQLAPRPG